MKNILKVLTICSICLLSVACSSVEKQQETPDSGELEEVVDPLLAYQNVPKDHVIQTLNYDEVLTTFEDGSGILILSFENCPYCQGIMSVANEVATSLALDNVYYFDVTMLETTKQREDLNVLLDEQLAIEDEEIVVYVPDVYVFKDGDVLGHHLGAVTSYDPYETKEMTEEQTEELIAIYTELFNQVK